MKNILLFVAMLLIVFDAVHAQNPFSRTNIPPGGVKYPEARESREQGEWHRKITSEGKPYKVYLIDGMFGLMGWWWIDDDGDGIAECYKFDDYCVLFQNTTTDDGFTVNHRGAWTVEGVEQKHPIGNPIAVDVLQDTVVDYTSLSSGKIPNLSDFDWYYWFNDGVRFSGPPSGRQTTNNYESLLGGWMALITNDPDNKLGEYSLQTMNINFSGSASAAKAVMRHGMIFIGGKCDTSYDESKYSPSVFMGSYKDGKLYLTGPGNIKINEVYLFDGRQYAIGVFDSPDGVPAVIALVRP
ncbi:MULTISPECIES: hypothetical protein [Bacteroidales]|uniref:hypothetical protein n=1 Tax=Bacteroidales TaxID=171549 RepID=UPI00359FD48D